MTDDELKEAAAWLFDLTGCTCPWEIITDHDLREYASNIIDDKFVQDNLTGSDMRAVNQLIRKLAPPEEQAREARRKKRKEKKYRQINLDDYQDVDSFLDVLLPSRKIERFSSSGAAARKRLGAQTASEIIRRFNSLNLPERERAAAISKALRLSSQHVRRVLKMAGLK